MARLSFGKRLSGFTNARKHSVTVQAVTGPTDFSAFVYECMLNVDWDGAPDAYGLDRPGVLGQTGLDPWESPRHRGSLTNARREADWGQDWVGIHAVTRSEAIHILRQNGLIPPKPAKGDVLSLASQEILRTHTAYGHSLENLAGDGKFPIVQIAEMPTTKKTGYYVSTTGWHDEDKELWDPNRYLDASAIPYSVVPALAGVGMGDHGLVIRNATGASIPYVCGDSSGAKRGSHRLGECSGAVYLAMGRENEGDFSFIVPRLPQWTSTERSESGGNAGANPIEQVVRRGCRCFGDSCSIQMGMGQHSGRFDQVGRAAVRRRCHFRSLINPAHRRDGVIRSPAESPLA